MDKANPLEAAREIINDVDEKMAELFAIRMRAAEIIDSDKKD